MGCKAESRTIQTETQVTGNVRMISNTGDVYSRIEGLKVMERL
jgi:hypothetical protein